MIYHSFLTIGAITLKDIKDLSGLIIIFLISIVLFVFRKEIRKLVNWITGFKKISKTKEGYELAGTSEPEEPLETEVLKKQNDVLDAESTQILEDAEKPTEHTEWHTAYTDGEYDIAIELLTKEIEKIHDIDEKISKKSLLGNIKFKQNKQDGISYFQELIENHKDSIHPYHWFALSHFWDEDYEIALDIIKQGLEQAKEAFPLIKLQASCLEKLGRWDDAVSTLESGIQQNSQYADYYVALSKLFFEREDKDSAQKWLKKGISACPKDLGLRLKYASVLSEEDKNEEALFQYRKLTTLAHKNVIYQGLLGNVYLNLGLNDKALEAYKRANQLANEQEAWIIGNIGNLYKNQGFYTQAIGDLKKALTIDPDSEYAHNRLAQAMAKQKKEREKEEKILKTVQKNMYQQSAGNSTTEIE